MKSRGFAARCMHMQPVCSSGLSGRSACVPEQHASPRLAPPSWSPRYRAKEDSEQRCTGVDMQAKQISGDLRLELSGFVESPLA
jgi:hypothetical protein